MSWESHGMGRHKLLWDGTDKYVPWTTLIDHKYNNNLVRIQFESRKAIYIFLQIVLGANKNKLPKGNQKDSGKQKCVSERTSVWVAPRTVQIIEALIVCSVIFWGHKTTFFRLYHARGVILRNPQNNQHRYFCGTSGNAHVLDVSGLIQTETICVFFRKYLWFQ